MDPVRSGSREEGIGKPSRQKDKKERNSRVLAIVEVKWVVAGFRLSGFREESGNTGKNK